jgi:hypothetical protein
VSAVALLSATESALRTFLNDPEGKVAEIQSDGRPPPGFGQWFYAVHWTGERNASDYTVVHYTDVEDAISVTITRRAGEIPTDRRKRLTITGELVDRARAIAAPGVIHGNYDLMNAANALIDGFGVTTNGFVEPLWYLGMGPIMEKPPNWVRAKDGKDVVAIEVRFGRARRLQIA